MKQIKNFKVEEIPENLIEKEINILTQGMKEDEAKKNKKNFEKKARERIKVGLILNAFGEKNITSYLKLKQQELKDFNSKESFSKKEPITSWEKVNTLDC